MHRRAVGAALTLVAALAGAAPARAADPNLERLVRTLRIQPITLLGETHDNAAQHALRTAALREHLAAGARPALVMEQFDREHQAALDRALARPGATPDDVIRAGAPDAAALRGWDWRHYRPYIELAIAYRLPVVAANVSRTDARRAVQGGLAALGMNADIPADLQRAQAQAIVASHCGAIDAAQAAPMVAAQVARDQFMARALQADAERGVVLLAGNGHVRRDIGVPRWLSPSDRARSTSVGLVEAGDDDLGAAFDVALTTPAQPRPDPCAEMRSQMPKRP